MLTKKEILEKRSAAVDRLAALNAEIGDNLETEAQTAEITQLSATIDECDEALVSLNNAADQAAARVAKLNAANDKAKSFNIGGQRTNAGRPHKLSKLSNDEVVSLSSRVLNAWANPLNSDADTIEDVKALGINPFGKELQLSLAPSHVIKEGRNGIERFAQGISQITTGGALIMPMFVQQLEKALLAYGGIRQYANVQRTAKSTRIPYPTLNSTSQSATIIGEGGSATENSITFGQVEIGAFKYTPGYFPVSRELLRDSEFDMGAIIGDVMGESIARGQAAHFISGTGGTQPMGILTASTSALTTAAATAFTFTELRQLITSIDPAYRQQASFLMHDDTVVAISNLVGGDGQFLWKRDPTGGNPGTLDGYPIRIDNNMATVAASAKPIAFGVLNKYLIRDVNTIRLQRLTELHALSDRDTFVAFMETDANLLNAGTNPVKYMTMHS